MLECGERVILEVQMDNFASHTRRDMVGYIRFIT